jgi:hypothetical protein
MQINDHIMKRFFFLIFITALSLGAFASTIEKTYYFGNYTLDQSGIYQMIRFDNTLLTGLPGEPALPYSAISLLLPPGEKAISIECIGENETYINGKFKLYPQQYVQPVSKGKSGKFLLSKDVYERNALYPSRPQGHLVTSYMNGYSFALSSFTPLKYNPATGQASYYKKVTIRITTSSSPEAINALENLSTSASVVNRVNALAQNAEMISEYASKGNTTVGYQMLIITPASYQTDFTQLQSQYLMEGIKSAVVTTETISGSMTGIDLPEKIRNYIIQEYQNNDIEYVLLGGDVELLPYRGFYCFVQSSSAYEDSDIPSDLYYSALDGNWNTDNDDWWGEPGEDDLLADIAVSRLPFSNHTELTAMLHKSISYQFSPVTGELHNPLIAGENLYDNPETWGSDYLELLIGYHTDNGYTTNGIPSTQPIDKMYDEITYWSGSDLIARLNQGRSFLHHSGHANQTYVMKLSDWDITNSNFYALNGTTHNYTLVYTHGCDCGAFDYSDCIAEKMVTIENFAAAFIGNSRYGWFNEGQTEGPSAHMHREFVDALYTDKLNRLGRAHMESKIATAPWVTAPGQWEPGAIRWCFYDCNALGDPAMAIWTDEPVSLTVDYLSAIPVGSPSLAVTITNNGFPVQGMNCTLLKNGVMHGTTVSDVTGSAVISFDPPVTELGDAQLVVSGYNCLPITYPVTFIENAGAYVVYASYVASDPDGNNNGLVEYGEPINLTVGMQNLGTADAQNVTVTLSCADPFVTLTDITESYGTIAAGATVSVPNGFSFDVASNVPDNHPITFTVTAQGSSSWTSEFTITAYAPLLSIGSITVDDNAGGNGNGRPDPGETGVLHIQSSNLGHSNALNTFSSLTVNNNDFQISNPFYSIGNLAANETVEALYNFTVSNQATVGTTIDLTNILTSGQYADTSVFTQVIGLIDEDFETGDFNKYEWELGGNQPWTISSVTPFEGSYCSISGAISNDQTSELSIEFEVLNADSISFFRKVSSEPDYDFLRFYVDDSKKIEWSGDQDWQRYSCFVNTGVHTFRWTYEKDITMTSGSDAAWVDYIIFPPVATITSTGPEASTYSFGIYPNPTSGKLTVNYHLSAEMQVKLTLCDETGRELMIVKPTEIKPAGNYTATSDLSALESGVYFLRMDAGKSSLTRKVVVR